MTWFLDDLIRVSYSQDCKLQRLKALGRRLIAAGHEQMGRDFNAEERTCHALTGWIPIRTAPKDGTRIIACGTITWPDGIGPMPADRGPHPWRGETYWHANRWHVLMSWVFEPTHWMPYPPTPGASQTEDDRWGPLEFQAAPEKAPTSAVARPEYLAEEDRKNRERSIGMPKMPPSRCVPEWSSKSFPEDEDGNCQR